MKNETQPNYNDQSGGRKMPTDDAQFISRQHRPASPQRQSTSRSSGTPSAHRRSSGSSSGSTSVQRRFQSAASGSPDSERSAQSHGQYKSQHRNSGRQTGGRQTAGRASRPSAQREKVKKGFSLSDVKDLLKPAKKGVRLTKEQREKFRRHQKLIRIALAVFAVIIVSLIMFCIFYQENPLKLKESDSPIYVSEYMSKNSHYYDENGKTTDWIELYNPSSQEVDLSKYKLVMGKKKYKFGSVTIAAKSYYLLFMGDGSSKQYTGLKLDNDAEEVFYIKDSNGKLVDLVNTQVVKKNKSIIRSYKDGELTEKVFKTPTPGFANNKTGLSKYLKTRHKDNDTGIAFNEVMSSNKNTYVDEFGNTVDYIELINTSDKTVNLSSFGLTDDESDPFKYQFPNGTKLKSGDVILINCSSDYKTKDENGETVLTQSDEGAYLAPFSINSGKEEIFLANSDAYLIEEFSPDIAGSDQSIIRDDEGNYSTTYYISPGYLNNDDGVNSYFESVKSVSDLSTVYISEAMSKNNAYAPVNENYYDWVELYNPTDKDIDLTGYTLSDSSKKTDKFKFDGQTIAAKSYLLIYCSKESHSGMTSTGFNLNGGCACYLFDAKGTMLDKVTLGELITDVSKGRNAGDSKWVYYSTPTPGEANGDSSDAIVKAPVASVKSGQYNSESSLSVELSAEGTIYYTTEGSLPTKSSKKYTGAITINKTSVIRAYAYSGKMRSALSTFSYIVNEKHNMDVVSVVSDPDGMFSDSTGIYSSNGASDTFPYFGANFWQNWKRFATLQLLPKEGSDETGFSIDGETSIFGGYSRGYDKKSLKFKFKDVYGSGSLKYSVFENRDFADYDSLVLRPCGQDVNTALMRDDLITTLADPVVDVMASRPVVLYINGDYYGIYYIREKINAKFVATHYDVSEDSVDLLQSSGDVNAGSNEEWYELKTYIQSHDLSNDEYYNYVTDRVDVQNFADYVIAEMYCGNTDGGNIRWFKSSEGDNKWRWILYDTDYGLTQRDYSFYNLINPNTSMSYEMFPRFLINGLFQNQKFRDLFVERLEYQMNNIWNADNVIATIDKFADAIADEIPRNHERWDLTASNWDTAVEKMREFARVRQSQLEEEFATSSGLRSIIALTDEELAKCFPDVSSSDTGTSDVSSDEVNSNEVSSDEVNSNEVSSDEVNSNEVISDDVNSNDAD